MKYLKKFKIFESDQPHHKRLAEFNIIKNECYDILLPLSDDGVNVSVDVSSGIFKDSLYPIKIVLDYGAYCDFMKYNDSFNHLFSYMNECGFKFKSSFTNISGPVFDIESFFLVFDRHMNQRNDMKRLQIQFEKP